MKALLNVPAKLATSSLVALALSTTACSVNLAEKEVPSPKIDLASIEKDMALGSKEKAEILAASAERLLTPASFMYAAEVAKMALTHDPQNTKARFINAALGPVMELKGVVTRIEPLVKTRPENAGEYYQFKASLQKYNADRSVTEFLLKGAADITTEREAQELIARVILKVDEFRRTMKDLKNEELTLTISEASIKKEMLDEAQHRCWSRTAPGVYEKAAECDLSAAYERKLNRADFEGLQQLAAGYQVYMTVLNAWDLTGLYSKNLSGVSSERYFEILALDSRFGKLRETNGMNLIPEAAQDAVIGVRYAQKMQAELCPNGYETPSNRPGSFLENGFCVENNDVVEKTLAIVEEMAKGGFVNFTREETQLPIDVKANAFKFFETPVRDLRDLQPTSKNACGQVTSIQDGTVGGVFANGEMNLLLAKASEESCKSH